MKSRVLSEPYGTSKAQEITQESLSYVAPKVFEKPLTFQGERIIQKTNRYEFGVSVYNLIPSTISRCIKSIPGANSAGTFLLIELSIFITYLMSSAIK